MWNEPTEEERKETLKKEARRELIKYKALRLLLTDNDLGAHIDCGGFSMGVCDNSTLIPAIDDIIREIQKAIKGKPNKWE
jgi:hypothetical protein